MVFARSVTISARGRPQIAFVAVTSLGDGYSRLGRTRAVAGHALLCRQAERFRPAPFEPHWPRKPCRLRRRKAQGCSRVPARPRLRFVSSSHHLRTLSSHASATLPAAYRNRCAAEPPNRESCQHSGYCARMNRLCGS